MASTSARSGERVPADAEPIEPPDITAWQAFSEIDVLLALFALPAIGVPISAALSKVPTAPVAFTVISTCASFLAVLLVLFRLLDQPGSNALVAVKYGAWIGLAGALLALRRLLAGDGRRAHARSRAATAPGAPGALELPRRC